MVTQDGYPTFPSLEEIAVPDIMYPLLHILQPTETAAAAEVKHMDWSQFETVAEQVVVEAAVSEQALVLVAAVA